MKRIKNVLLTIIIIILIFNIKIIINSTYEASILFFTKVFVSIFPFIILSEILINYDYHIFIKNIFGKFFSKLFNIDSNTSIIIILSILTSHPGNAIYINKMLEEKQINIETANKLLCFTYFPSIAFVIGSVGYGIFNSIKIGILLYVCSLLSNLSIGIFLRKETIPININIEINNNKNIFVVIKSSINNAIKTLYLILGNLILFTIISNLIKIYLPLNNTLLYTLSGIFEMTNGIFNIGNANINLNLKLSLISFLLNFSGLSIFFQSFSILSKYKINIKKILILKLIFSIIYATIFLFI